MACGGASSFNLAEVGRHEYNFVFNLASVQSNTYVCAQIDYSFPIQRPRGQVNYGGKSEEDRLARRYDICGKLKEPRFVENQDFVKYLTGEGGPFSVVDESTSFQSC